MRIADAFGQQKLVFSFEFFPPKTEEGVRTLLRTVGELKVLEPTFVSVTYGAGGSTQQLTVDLVSNIKRDIRLETMAHLTCVGRGAGEIAAVLDLLHEHGIENVLPLRGDPPTGEEHFIRPADGFGYAQELVRFIRPRWDFCLGGACYPEGHIESPDVDTDLKHLREKVDSGVDFLITQLFFDSDVYFRFVERARGLGINLPIVPGIMPITNAAQIERFTKLCGASIPKALHQQLDAVREDEQAVVDLGIEWASKQCRALLEGGAPGIHFYTLNKSKATRAVYQNVSPSITHSLTASTGSGEALPRQGEGITEAGPSRARGRGGFLSAELRTPLARVHEILGARMVPFCGWLMPVQYSGIVAEHLHTRASASLFDLSHMGRVRITGPGAEDLLQHATTNDVSRLSEGAAQYTLACNEDGGIIEDLIVYRFADEWRLIVNAVNRVRLLAHLEALRDRLEYAAEIEDETFDTALLGLQGPLSQEVLQPLVDEDLATLGYYRARVAHLSHIPALISRTGYTGEDGFEVSIEAAQAEPVWQALSGDPRVRPAGLGARDTLRLEAGMALYGHELADEINPYEAGLGRVVKLDKDEFLGRDALKALSQSPKRSLIGLVFERGAVPRAGCTVHSDSQMVGEVASGTFSPSLNRPIATAYVQAPTPAQGSELAVSIRNALVPARVVSLPFVPHHTKKG